MKKAKFWVILTLSIITIAVFVVFIFPNKAASKDEAMVNIFQPDEYATWTVVGRMTAPKPDRPSFMQHYFLYNFYHYGFPYFSISSLPVFLARWTNQFDNMPFVMVSLRQFVSVLPSLIAILILVYIQDQFSSYKSILLYILLLSFPAVVNNNMWWHPDGLCLLFSALTLFFLWKDEQKFGKYFYIAAIFAGILTATKLIGVFFLVAIIPILLLQMKTKKWRFVEAIGQWAIFAFILAIAFVISNPFLFTFDGLTRYAFTLYNEFAEISAGYGLVYDKGFAAAWAGIQPAYGKLPFFIALVFAFFLGFRDKNKKKLSTLILCWFLPLTFTVLFTTHFKYQYWLPAAIPAFSMLYLLLPDKSTWKEDKLWLKISKIAFTTVVIIQIVLFNIQNVQSVKAQIEREQTSESIRFYHHANRALAAITHENRIIYHDYRVYVPINYNPWFPYTSFEMLNYAYIVENNFDVLFLQNQRVLDYLNPDSEGVDNDLLETARLFYADVRDNKIEGYVLLYEDDFGKAFVRDDLYEKYYLSP
ncbi:MAG TPA: glycosyltransferase family 39 protein [Anaerolineaceae bacterium]|nr:glycosyltransferase family 39 protein [Anaerolineaceae bacterium]